LKLACEITKVQQVFATQTACFETETSAFFLPSVQGFCYIYTVAFFFTLQWHAAGCSCGIWQHFWPQHDLMLQISHGFFMCWQSPVVDG
jgi:hypothetical protein